MAATTSKLSFATGGSPGGWTRHVQRLPLPQSMLVGDKLQKVATLLEDPEPAVDRAHVAGLARAMGLIANAPYRAVIYFVATA